MWVPELTRGVDIQVNKRVPLWSAAEILSSGSRAVLARCLRSPARPCVFRAIRGRRFARGRRPRPIAFGLESLMTRRRTLILSIVTAGCWIVLLAIVLSSVFASTLTKQIRNKDRQSAQPQ